MVDSSCLYGVADDICMLAGRMVEIVSAAILAFGEALVSVDLFASRNFAGRTHRSGHGEIDIVR